MNMEKTIKKTIYFYKDGSSQEKNEGGTLLEHLNSGWKLINTEQKSVENTGSEIISVKEFIYLIKNDTGLMFD